MKNFTVEYFEYPPVSGKKSVSRHFQIYYCQRGWLSHRVNGNSSIMSHGDVAILPPDIEHEVTIMMPYTVYFAISFDETTVLPCFAEELRKGNFIYPKITLPPKEIVFFEGCMYKILSEFTEKKANYEFIIKDVLSVLQSILQRCCYNLVGNSPSVDKEAFIKYCISYTDAHCCEDISLNEIVKLSTMSKALFCNLFKQETGLSFKDYLNRKRIQKAFALIKAGEKITEIAYMCGYTQQSTFYRNFNKFSGKSPTRFRDECFNRE